MDFAEIFRRLREGLQLLAAWPLRWFAVSVLLFLIVEALALLPVVGFSLKVVLTALFAGTVMRLFAAADRGEPPPVSGLFAIHRLGLGGGVALAVSALLPFHAALALTAWLHGSGSVAFFFGSPLQMEPPPAVVFQNFKTAFYLFSVPFVFVAPAVALRHLGGWTALREAVTAAAAHWRAPVLLFLFSFAYELLMARLPEFFPLAGVILVSVLVLTFYIAAMLAFTYVLGRHALGVRGSTD